MWYMCMMEFNPGIKKKEFLPSAANCMQLKDIIWSEISWPEEKITRHVLPYMQKLRKKGKRPNTKAKQAMSMYITVATDTVFQT